MNKIHDDIKGINFILKNKLDNTEKDKLKKSLFKGYNKAKKETTLSKNSIWFDLPYQYRVAYHAWQELKEFMKLFNLDINNTDQKSLSYKIIQEIGEERIPIFRISTDEYIKFKEEVNSEFVFIDDLFQWVKKHYPTQKKRAVKALQANKNQFIFNDYNQTSKALEILQLFKLNQNSEAKIYLLEKLLLPFELSQDIKNNLLKLLKL